MKDIHLLKPIALFALFLCLTCTDKDFDTEAPNFNIALFEQNVVDSLSGQVPGFAYAINQNGQLYNDDADGFANINDGVFFTSNTRMHVASISKTITAVALLKLLSENPGADVESKIAGYLPGYWDKGVDIGNLTFKNLLQHRSGFLNEAISDTFFEDIRKLVADGIDESKRDGDVDYRNPNYAFFRLFIPILNGKLNPNVTPDDSLDFALSYIAYVNNEILRPMGIDPSYCQKKSTNQLRYYDCVTLDRSSGSGDMTFRAAPFGWHLSALELAAFNAHLRYNDDILDPATRKLMDDEYLGWDNGHSSANGDHGTYLFHEGQWHTGDGGLRACIMHYPNDVEVAITFNCVDHTNPNLDSPRRFLRMAYDAAWE